MPVGDDGGAVPGAVVIVGEGEMVGVIDGVAERECGAGTVDDLEVVSLDGDGDGRAAGVRLGLAAGAVVRAVGRSAAGVGRRTR